jgi:2,4-dienoyl-CoA reductase-like NADH-dependent reductase (Old Yellow Enzyme family)
MPELGEPVRLGTRTMRNRVMHLAVNTGFAVDHRVGDRLFAYWRRRAEGAAGAVVSGLTPVHPDSLYKSSVPKNTADEDLPQLRRFAEAVGGGGALSLVQLVHNGAQMVPRPGGPVPVSPSGIPVPGLGQPCRALTEAGIAEVIEAFAAAAERCRLAGVDGVEVHGAHGFLIHQFLSPLTNRRDDDWGGSPRRRRRLAREILRAVRARTGPDFVVGFRLVADEFSTGGITAAEARDTARVLADEGLVDYLSVSAGNYGTLERAISPYPVAGRPLVELTAGVRAAVRPDVPVVAANRLLTRDDARAVLDSGAADIVGLGRALVADPDWERPCISCNACFAGGGVTTSEGIECAVDPELALGPDDSPPSAEPFLVVGAGVAGLAFALEATRLGHPVVIRERERVPGGQVALYSDLLTGGLFTRYVDWAVATLADRGVRIEYGREVTAAEPDEHAVVVLATGARPVSLPVLLDPPRGGDVVVVAGDPGPEPLQLAAALAGRGCRVRLDTADDPPGPACEGLTRRILLGRIGRHTAPETEPDTDPDIGPRAGRGRLVHSGPREPVRTLAAVFPDAHLIGDCAAPGTIADATRSGYRLARDLHRLSRPAPAAGDR